MCAPQTTTPRLTPFRLWSSEAQPSRGHTPLENSIRHQGDRPGWRAPYSLLEGSAWFQGQLAAAPSNSAGAPVVCWQMWKSAGTTGAIPATPGSLPGSKPREARMSCGVQTSSRETRRCLHLVGGNSTGRFIKYLEPVPIWIPEVKGGCAISVVMHGPNADPRRF